MKCKEFFEKYVLPIKRNLIIQIVIVPVILLLFFVHFSFILNTKIGIEIGVTGWNYIATFFTMGFKNGGEACGGFPVPFFYYAKVLSIICLALTFIAFLSGIIIVGLSIYCLVKLDNDGLRLIRIVSFGMSGSLILIFILSLFMNASQILPGYCGGNPACSIGSFAIFPAIVAGFGTFSLFIALKQHFSEE